MLLFCFPFSLNSAFLCACVRVWGEAVGMKNECKVLVRIKKGYGWQLEEHLKIAGTVSLVGSRGWDQGVSRAWSCSSCCGEGGWGLPTLQGDGAFLFFVSATWPGQEACCSLGLCQRGYHVIQSSKNYIIPHLTP